MLTFKRKSAVHSPEVCQEELPVITKVRPNKFLLTGLNIFGAHYFNLWD